MLYCCTIMMYCIFVLHWTDWQWVGCLSGPNSQTELIPDIVYVRLWIAFGCNFKWKFMQTLWNTEVDPSLQKMSLPSQHFLIIYHVWCFWNLSCFHATYYTRSMHDASRHGICQKLCPYMRSGQQFLAPVFPCFPHFPPFDPKYLQGLVSIWNHIYLTALN